jgi:triacylglycerol lipase
MCPASGSDGDSTDTGERLRTALHRAKSWLGARVAGLRAHVAHAREHLRRVRAPDGPTSRKAVLRSLGSDGPQPQQPAVGETCDRPRTDDSGLPWRTFRWYGGWGGADYWDTESGTERTPIVFVHGNGGDACNFDDIAGDCLEHGYRGDELWGITFGTFTPTHAEMSAQLDDFVRHVRAETGAESVSIVAHSLGVTGTRFWLHERERHDWLDTFVGMGGANSGTCGCPGCEDASDNTFTPEDAARACRSVARQCRDVEGHPLAVLSDADPTPGNVEYVMIRGRFDPIYWCDRRSPYLDGAENVAVSTTHMGLLGKSETVRAHVE